MLVPRVDPCVYLQVSSGIEICGAFRSSSHSSQVKNNSGCRLLPGPLSVIVPLYPHVPTYLFAPNNAHQNFPIRRSTMMMSLILFLETTRPFLFLIFAFPRLSSKTRDLSLAPSIPPPSPLQSQEGIERGKGGSMCQGRERGE